MVTDLHSDWISMKLPTDLSSPQNQYRQQLVPYQLLSDTFSYYFVSILVNMTQLLSNAAAPSFSPPELSTLDLRLLPI